MDSLGIVARLSNGHLLDDLAEALERVSAEVSETGKPGAVTLKLAIKPLGEAGNVMVGIEETISRTPPKRPARGSIFYSVDGGLFRDDPRQTRLDFRAVPVSDTEIRETDADAPSVREA